jgi:hypothetical protein
MLKNKVPFEELPVEEQFKKVFDNYKRQIQEGVLFDVMTAFYFADWTRKCDYDKMTSEEVVEAAMAICKKLEEKYNYSLDNEFFGSGVFNDADWSGEGCEDI